MSCCQCFACPDQGKSCRSCCLAPLSRRRAGTRLGRTQAMTHRHAAISAAHLRSAQFARRSSCPPFPRFARSLATQRPWRSSSTAASEWICEMVLSSRRAPGGERRQGAATHLALAGTWACGSLAGHEGLQEGMSSCCCKGHNGLSSAANASIILLRAPLTAPSSLPAPLDTAASQVQQGRVPRLQLRVWPAGPGELGELGGGDALNGARRGGIHTARPAPPRLPGTRSARRAPSACACSSWTSSARPRPR